MGSDLSLIHISTWDKIIESDQYLKMNTEKIPDIRIRNYTKVKLAFLKPDTDVYKRQVHNPCADQDYACKHVDHEHSDLSSQNAESIHLSSPFFS